VVQAKTQGCKLGRKTGMLYLPLLIYYSSLLTTHYKACDQARVPVVTVQFPDDHSCCAVLALIRSIRTREFVHWELADMSTRLVVVLNCSSSRST
jgi:hypothetical protein